jgi:uncharacterized short protein YbdD (DUF466 family)
MPHAIQFAQRVAKFVWQALRHITGDAAYETYVRYCETRHAVVTTSTNDIANRSTAINESSHSTSTPKIMTREQFYTDSLRRKYSTINRCC